MLRVRFSGWVFPRSLITPRGVAGGNGLGLGHPRDLQLPSAGRAGSRGD